MTENELTKMLTEHECRIERLEERMNILEKMQAQIQELTLSVHDLSISIKTLVGESQEMNSRISEIEKEPAEKWKKFTTTIISCVISAIVGAIITFLVK